MTIEERVVKCFENNGALVQQDGKIDEGIDSIEFISTIIDLEKEFSIEFPSDFLAVHMFTNISGFANLIKELLNY